MTDGKKPDPDHLQLTPHLTAVSFEEQQMREAIEKTYLGQAHIAGTGPSGMTCRECIFWKLRPYERLVVDKATGARKYVTIQPPDYRKDGELHRHSCTYPIHGKAKRRIPHDAWTCRLFEEDPAPLPIKKVA